jgi:glycerol-3-phosphate O-acyltransferase
MSVRRDEPLDDIARAVLARDEVVRYLSGRHGDSGVRAEERVHAYLDELRTRQRYSIYRALKHPLYPILRKIERVAERADVAAKAIAQHRVVYISNHRSHTDYLVEPMVLEDLAVRPPVIAAGINLFGGPLGLIHRHVTGAIPIRRNTKDPAYLVTLKAYVAEVLRRHDLLFYIEGGRSYSGELKSPKTGLVHAALLAGQPGLVFVPCAVSYDLVLEDFILARQRVKKQQRPFGRELAEMVRYAVGYRSRAFVTFGDPLAVEQCDPHSRRDVLDLAHSIRNQIGRMFKVVPTCLLAAALRRSAPRHEAEDRVAALIDTLRAVGANLAVTDPAQAVEEGARMFEARGVVVCESGRLRIRDRTVLRYYARALDHLLTEGTGRTH